MPAGGHNKLPYRSVQVRCPEPCKKQVEDVIASYRAAVREGREKEWYLEQPQSHKKLSNEVMQLTEEARRLTAEKQILRENLDKAYQQTIALELKVQELKAKLATYEKRVVNRKRKVDEK